MEGNYNMDGTFVFVLGYIIAAFVCGFIGVNMLREKGYKAVENHGFAWGFWLGPLGIIVCAIKPDKKQTTQAYIPTQNQTSIKNQLKELEELKNQGLITEEEFTAKKKQILGI